MFLPLRCRSPRWFRSLAPLGLAVVWATLAAAAQPFSDKRLPPEVQVSFSPLEAELFSDADDGSLDTHSLLSAALTASGVDDAHQIARYQRQYDAWSRQLRRSGTVSGEPRERARAVFDFLHARILWGDYRAACTDLTETFERGDYNCISATILFNCLCADFDLHAVAVEGPGHAISRLTVGAETLDVETTCPDWFVVLDDPAAVSPAGQHPPATRTLSPAGLVAVIYYNRGVDLIERREFARAMAANAKALRLDPANATAQGNLLAALNNWALDLSSRQEFEAAERLLAHGCAIAPYYRMFQTNLAAVHHRVSASQAPKE